ncbi:MAG: helicase, partial [Planctomycetota bacterium]
MKQVELDIPSQAALFLREAISQVNGNEVYFLGRVSWNEKQTVATLGEVEVFARGNSVAAPAIIAGAEDWDLAIHNHPGGDLQPSDADLSVAAELGNRGVGFAIIDNEASRNYLVVKPFIRQDFQPVDLEEVRGILAPGGLLASGLEGFESRPGQVEMALEVARSLNENGVVAAEAGTGIGKSFAYLVPCILWAVKNRQRVVISTGTINLQE